MEKFLSSTSSAARRCSGPALISMTPLDERFVLASSSSECVFPPSEEARVAVQSKRSEALALFETATDAAGFAASEAKNQEYLSLQKEFGQLQELFELVRQSRLDCSAVLKMELALKEPNLCKAGEWKMLLRTLEQRMKPFEQKLEEREVAAKEALKGSKRKVLSHN